MTALSTTKRKFAKLLDNLTANSHSAHTPPQNNASTAPVAPRIEPPSKRSRLSDVSSEAENRPATPGSASSKYSLLRSQILNRQTPDQNTPSSVWLIKPAAGAKISPYSARRTPNYAPWNQEQFLARLKSFADVKLWSPKPDPLSEVEWAKRGWVLDGWNKVACKGGCEQRLSIRLRPKRKDLEGKEVDNTEDELVDVEEELVYRYVELVSTAHSESCLWRRFGCKSDIYHVPLARRENCERGLKARYDSLITLEASLPPLESLSIPSSSPSELISLFPASLLSTPSTTTQPASTSPTLPTPNPSSPSHPSPPHPPAILLSIHGWTGVLQSTLPLLLCTHCFQRIGLWMYTSARMHEMSASLSLPREHLRLKLADAHREHCPWRSGASQHNPAGGPLEGLNAWETLVHTLRRTSRSAEGAGVGRRYSVVAGGDNSRPSTSVTLSPVALTRPDTSPTQPGGDAPNTNNLEDTQETDVYTEHTATEDPPLTPAELEKLDRERTTKWHKLKARMSFRRPKSAGGKSVAGETDRSGIASRASFATVRTLGTTASRRGTPGPGETPRKER